MFLCQAPRSPGVAVATPASRPTPPAVMSHARGSGATATQVTRQLRVWVTAALCALLVLSATSLLPASAHEDTADVRAGAGWRVSAHMPSSQQTGCVCTLCHGVSLFPHRSGCKHTSATMENSLYHHHGSTMTSVTAKTDRTSRVSGRVPPAVHHRNAHRSSCSCSTDTDMRRCDESQSLRRAVPRA